MANKSVNFRFHYPKCVLIEPIKSFVPSIGISEVVKLDKEKNLYLIGSMKEQTLFIVKPV